MFNCGDKLITTKRVVGFLNEGDIVEVTKVDSDMISFESVEETESNRRVEGRMSLSEIEKYFEKIVENTEVDEDTYIDRIIENSEIEVYTAFDKCTIVACRLPNNYVIVESHTFTDSEIYNEETGATICLNKIVSKICELEEYRMASIEEYVDTTDECIYGCDNCENCPCESHDDCYNEEEFDECLDTDLDCDDCDDYDCPFNTNN